MSNNTEIVIKALNAAGITNPYAIAGIMAIIKKESNFKPQSELAYSNTSNERIRAIFSATKYLDDSQLTALKKDPEKFFNFVYGGRYGNAKDEGYKYRGRGFNQLTFKDNYKKFGDAIGVNLVANPDLANKPDIAARIVAAYMLSQFKKNASIVSDRYGVKHINDFKDTTTAVNAFYNANAGFGKDTSRTNTQGKTEALGAVKDLYKKTISFLNTDGGKVVSFGTVLLIGAALYFLNSK